MHGHASRTPPSGTPVVVRSKIWLEVDGRFAVGGGAIALLDAVATRGSLRQAAAAIGWSYRHAWDYLRQAERALGVALIATASERPRAGSVLTRAGEGLLASLQALEEAARRESDRAFRGCAISKIGHRGRPLKL